MKDVVHRGTNCANSDKAAAFERWQQRSWRAHPHSLVATCSYYRFHDYLVQLCTIITQLPPHPLNNNPCIINAKTCFLEAAGQTSKIRFSDRPTSHRDHYCHTQWLLIFCFLAERQTVVFGNAWRFILSRLRVNIVYLGPCTWFGPYVWKLCRLLSKPQFIERSYTLKL